MAQVGVAQHMAEQTQIGQGVLPAGAVDTEQMGGGPAAGEPVQGQRPQAEEKEGEDNGGIVLEAESEFGTFRGGQLLSAGMVFHHCITAPRDSPERKRPPARAKV